MNSAESWNYFIEDAAYVDVLAGRLREGVEMDSSIGLANLLRDRLHGDLSILDFGSGPGHYVPVLKRIYDHGALSYRGVDILQSSVEIGNAHFADDPFVSFEVGSVLEPAASYRGENCILSANTLPHIPDIRPLLSFIRETPSVTAFAFRMLIGRECVQSRKHLSETDFDDLFDGGYQFNNIYSRAFLQHMLGEAWQIDVVADYVDLERLANHTVPAQKQDPFYSNRVSQLVGGMTFKGDVYMPWKLVFGQRNNDRCEVHSLRSRRDGK